MARKGSRPPRPGNSRHVCTVRQRGRGLLIIPLRPSHATRIGCRLAGPIAVRRENTYLTFMPSKLKPLLPTDLIAQWPLPPGATLGSSVRAKGIVLEVRAALSNTVKKSIDVIAGTMVLRMPQEAKAEFDKTMSVVTAKLEGIESLPIIPREIEDILSISVTERHRWLKDGRLPSAGTRTVKLRGRAKKITFHIFDPRKVEDILNDDLVTVWREDDAVTAIENRRRAAWKAKLARADKKAREAAPNSEERPNLVGWDAFEREGLLR